MNMRKKPPAKKNRPIQAALPVRNIFFFAVLVLVGNAPLWVFSDAIMPFRQFMAWLVAGLIHLSGLDVVQNGAYITLKNEQWVMSPECTALTAMIVFAAFVIAYPSSIKSKTIAVLAGIPFIVFANIVRLFTLAWVTELFAGYAHWVHDYVWQVAFLMLIALMWLVWIERVVKRENQTAVSA